MAQARPFHPALPVPVPLPLPVPVPLPVPIPLPVPTPPPAPFETPVLLLAPQAARDEWVTYNPKVVQPASSAVKPSSQREGPAYSKEGLAFRAAYKTRLCETFRDWNHCAYGRRCNYAHGSSDFQNARAECHYFNSPKGCLQGECCVYRHGEGSAVPAELCSKEEPKRVVRERW